MAAEGTTEQVEACSSKTVGVIGTGSYGTALSYVLAKSGNHVIMWSRRPAVCDSIANQHVNPQRFSDKILPDNITANSDLSEVIENSELVVLSITAQSTYGFLEANKELFLSSRRPVLCTSKGIDRTRKLFMHGVICEVLGDDYPCAFLSGPTFAKEMMMGHPMAVVVAGTDESIVKTWQSCFDRRFFRCYANPDVMGVEIGGALKNPLAIGAGMARGMGFGISTTAGLVTRGIHEMQKLCLKLGGDVHTLQGLAGMGDLMCTCFSELSRNNRFGYLIGKEGCSLEEAAERIGEVVEGAATASVVLELMEEHNVRMPLFRTVAEILAGKTTVEEGLNFVMQKEVAGVYELPALKESVVEPEK